MFFFFSSILILLLSGCNLPSITEPQEKYPYNTNIPLNDSNYPYAGIPRIVIETANKEKIDSRTESLDAQLQVYGKKTPETEIFKIQIHGRGNTSWTDMPKKSYTIKFDKKTSLLGLAKGKKWALIANYSDKSLLRNFIMYKLSKELGAYYTPEGQFVELFLNKVYMGVYLLMETIEVSPERLHFDHDNGIFLLEFDEQPKANDIYFSISPNRLLRIHYPKKTNDSTIKKLERQIEKFNSYLEKEEFDSKKSICDWISCEDYILHYWLQEFSNNCDANFRRSVYFSMVNDSLIKMGPVWDFDLSLGNIHPDIHEFTDKAWRIRKSYWNKHLFKDSTFQEDIREYWKNNRKTFIQMSDSVKYYGKQLNEPAKNNFKRWNILSSTKNTWHIKAYQNYNEAVEDLSSWMQSRVKWIDSNL